MGVIEHSDVQFSDLWNDPRTFMRVVNDLMRRFAQTISVNFRESYPQVDALITADGTHQVWLPLERYDVLTVAHAVSTGTGSLTPRIDGVAMTVVGGTPISVTTTPTSTEVTGANRTAALSVVDLVVSGLTGNMTVSLGVRRGV